MTVRIAMWCGPRNVSTALMRAFESRGDCAVVDEPLYAAYLHATGVDHPGRDAILQSQPTNPVQAMRALAHPTHGRPLQFEKHMAQHWQRGWSLDDFGEARHAFLIRDPAAVARSYARVRGRPTPEDLGTLQQARLLQAVNELGHPPVLIDGDELRAHPEDMLRKLCIALRIPYVAAMLRWPPGRRAADGVWAEHWYARVEASTGFDPPDPGEVTCPPELVDVVSVLRPDFHHLATLRLRPSSDKET